MKTRVNIPVIMMHMFSQQTCLILHVFFIEGSSIKAQRWGAQLRENFSRDIRKKSECLMNFLYYKNFRFSHVTVIQRTSKQHGQQALSMMTEWHTCISYWGSWASLAPASCPCRTVVTEDPDCISGSWLLPCPTCLGVGILWVNWSWQPSSYCLSLTLK